MKRFLAFLLIIATIGTICCGCDQTNLDVTFAKPDTYAAVVNVELGASFDIYLDREAVVLAIEPKNEDAKKLELSNVVGLDLFTAAQDIMHVMCENTYIDRNTEAYVKYVEGQENVTEFDAVQILSDVCTDTVASMTVNESMDSVLQVCLERDIGCQCIDCINWYAMYWYSYHESMSEHPDQRRNEKLSREQYAEYWKKTNEERLDKLDENDPSYGRWLETYNEIKYKNFDYKEICRHEFLFKYNKGFGNLVHEECEITYKIVDVITDEYTDRVAKTEEFSAEEYFERCPEEREGLKGLEKVVKAELEVCENGRLLPGYYAVWLYLCDGKWYASGALGWTFNP